MYVCMYIHIYIYKQDSHSFQKLKALFSPAEQRDDSVTRTRKGTNGVSANGVAANFMFFDRGTCWVLLLSYD